ncbi:MAG TPA: hypothetical protein VHT91_40300 [Kofleriaceae bacterium]|nr:hypothetical protein [Kofleriaceae bacterium]
MPERAIDPAEAGPSIAASSPAPASATAKRAVRGKIAAAIRKRWRAWLRAVHRDIGYLAVGFTVIYAASGIAMNHIDDWDPNFHATELTRKIAPIDPGLSDAEATRRIAEAAGAAGAIDDVYRAGDEVRLSYQDGTKLTAIGDTLTVQRRRDRFFFRVADWLHATRGKQAWKFIADLYAAILLYLAISGIFMIKGRLGLRWRGAALIALGLAAPLGYIVLSGGPGAQRTERVAARPGEVDPPAGVKPPPRPGDSAKPAEGAGIRPLPPDDNEPAKGAEIRPLPPDDDH